MTFHSKPEEILEDMLNTFRERGEKYGNNYIEIGDVLDGMFPNGLTLESPEDHRLYHIFLMILVKMTRLANSNLRHRDSFRDIGVYAAMGESLVELGDNLESGRYSDPIHERDYHHGCACTLCQERRHRLRPFTEFHAPRDDPKFDWIDEDAPTCLFTDCDCPPVKPLHKADEDD